MFAAGSRIVEKPAAVRVGDPFDDATTMGALINQKQADRVHSYVSTGRAYGAKVAVGGTRPDGLSAGPTSSRTPKRRRSASSSERLPPRGRAARLTDKGRRSLSAAAGTELPLSVLRQTRLSRDSGVWSMRRVSGDRVSPPTIYQHPLAYLLGLEGVALMRAFAGEYDQAFTVERFGEIRDLLDRAHELGPGVEVSPMPVVDGYDGWAVTYDGEDNGCFPMRDDLLAPMLDRLDPGRALDAACGTGAVARQLVARGHEVTGIDVSEGMLTRARKAVPDATFLVGELTDLPIPDGSVDHVVCSLALTHLADLNPFFSEAVRVMKPGGHLLVLDTRGHFTGSGRYPLIQQAPDGRLGYIAGYSHGLGDYVRAALTHKFILRACEEAYRGDVVDADEAPEPLTPGPPDIWDLHPWIARAANAAKAGQPAVVAWDMQLRPEV